MKKNFLMMLVMVLSLVLCVGSVFAATGSGTTGELTVEAECSVGGIPALDFSALQLVQYNNGSTNEYGIPATVTTTSTFPVSGYCGSTTLEIQNSTSSVAATTMALVGTSDALDIITANVYFVSPGINTLDITTNANSIILTGQIEAATAPAASIFVNGNAIAAVETFSGNIDVVAIND